MFVGDGSDAISGRSRSREAASGGSSTSRITAIVSRSAGFIGATKSEVGYGNAVDLIVGKLGPRMRAFGAATTVFTSGASRLFPVKPYGRQIPQMIQRNGTPGGFGTRMGAFGAAQTPSRHRGIWT